MRYLLCWIALVALTGCSQGTWVKPGASEESFTSDRDACLQESSRSGGFIPDYTFQASPSGALIRGNPYGTSQAQALSGSRVSSGTGHLWAARYSTTSAKSDRLTTSVRRTSTRLRLQLMP